MAAQSVFRLCHLYARVFKMIELCDYQKKAHEFATYSMSLPEHIEHGDYQERVKYLRDASVFLYPSSKLAGEAGEIALKVDRCPRDFSRAFRVDILKECGDVLWYLAEIHTQLGSDLYQSIQTYHQGNTAEAVEYVALRLCGRCGAVAEMVAKQVRDKGVVRFKDVSKEDVVRIEEALSLAFRELASLAQYFEFPMEEVAQANIEKLSGRADRGTLLGSGDNR